VDYGPNPANLESITIPDELCKIYDGEQFLFADSGAADSGRILIFTIYKQTLSGMGMVLLQWRHNYFTNFIL